MSHGFSTDPGAITALLRRQAEGDLGAEGELFLRVYENLHAIAARKIRGERHGHTLQPTALVHEAYLAIIKSENIDWSDRTHFFAVAARVMRRILIDYARQKGTIKRAGAQQRMDLDKADAFSLDNPDFLLALDQSMQRLKEDSERACQVVEMRVFAGLSLEEIASFLKVSQRTVKRDWQTAKLRLYRELYGSP